MRDDPRSDPIARSERLQLTCAALQSYAADLRHESTRLRLQLREIRDRIATLRRRPRR